MGLFRKIGEKLIGKEDVVIWDRNENPDNNPERGLVYRIPNAKLNDMRRIERFGARDYERVLFFRNGQLQGVLEGGVYELDKEARNPATEIVWVDIGILQVPWGVPHFQGRLMTEEGFKVGMNGHMRFKVADPTAFISKVVAYQKDFSDESTKEWIGSLYITSLADVVKKYTMVNLVRSNREDIIALIRTKMSREFQTYGLELIAADIIGFAWPPEHQAKVKELQEEKINEHGDLKDEYENMKESVRDLKSKLTELEDQWADGQIDDEEFEKKEARFKKLLSRREKELSDLKIKMDAMMKGSGVQN